MSRLSPCFLKMPPRWPSSAMPASQAPFCGMATLSVSSAAAARIAPASARTERTATTSLRMISSPAMIAYYLVGMTLRPPQASSSSRTAPIAALDYEIAQEQVSALGRMGRALEAALAALAEYDRRHGEKDAARARLVRDASDVLWCFMVQREAFGLRDPRPVIRDYRVPAEVHNRMGAFGRR